MNNKIRLLRLLADGEFHSGEELGIKLSISRSAVWKIVKSLNCYGIEVITKRGKGYCLPAKIEFLDQKILQKSLKHQVLEKISRLEIHIELASTNQLLLDRLATSSIHGHLVLAEYQTSGRGRRGNSWLSPLGGGISLSVGWHYNSPVESMTQLSLAAGIAVVRTLNQFNIDDAGLKWPNDIMCKGRKLGGILLEMRGESAGPCDIVLGIGLNYTLPENYSYLIDQAWTDIAGIISPLPSRNILVAALIDELIPILDTYSENYIQEIITEWRNYDCVKGRTAILLLPDQSITGRIMGIDDHGALLFSAGDEIKRYTTGEISMRVKS